MRGSVWGALGDRRSYHNGFPLKTKHDMQEVLKEPEGLLLRYYSAEHRYLVNLRRVMAVSDVADPAFSEAVGQLGWSGAGSFLDQVFLDVPRSKYEDSELRFAENKYKEFMVEIGAHALEVDPNTPNNLAIKSMLRIWQK